MDIWDRFLEEFYIVLIIMYEKHSSEIEFQFQLCLGVIMCSAYQTPQDELSIHKSLAATKGQGWVSQCRRE